jgi:hypothetical protein
VAALYLLAREFLAWEFALLTAAIYAVLPLTVLSSKYGVPDTMLSCLFIFNFWLQIRLHEKQTWCSYFWCGLGGALALATKYNACFLLFSFMVAHSLAARTRPQPWRYFFDFSRLGFGLSGTLIGLAIGFPLLPFEWKFFCDSLRYEYQHLFQAGHYGLKIAGLDYFYVFHFIKSILPTTGLLLLLTIIVGLGYICCRRQSKDLILLGALLPYYAAMEHIYKIPDQPERYVLPLVSLYILGAIILCQRLLSAFPSRRVIPLLFLIFAAFPLFKTSHLLYYLVPDTREIMKNWIESNLPSQTVIIEPWPLCPALYPAYNRARVQLLPEQLMRRVGNVLRRGHMLANSFFYETYRAYPDQDPPKTRFFQDLFHQGNLLFQAEPAYQTYLYHNPTLKLYGPTAPNSVGSGPSPQPDRPSPPGERP